MAATPQVIPERTVPVLDHGFVRLDDAMATDLSVVNAARVSFARRKDVMDGSDEGLIRFLMRDRHGTPFEHNAFRFHIRAPIFVAREWFRHRVGCLTGDTEITFVDTNGHAARGRRKTIDELWRMWTIGERNGHALSPATAVEVKRLAAAGVSVRAISRSLGVGRRPVRSQLAGRNAHRDARRRVRQMRLRVLDESTGEFVTGHIADILDQGTQPVYRLTLVDGKSVTLTANHRILTEDGWQTMGAAVGLRVDGDAEMTKRCAVMVNGVPVHQDADWLAQRRDAGRLCQQCRSRGGRLHAHHIAPAWLAPERARDVGDLITACDDRLRGIHRTQQSELAFAASHAPWIGFAKDAPPRTRGWRLTAHAVEVVAVEYVGLRQTYDLSVEGPWHNFVADGMVVHNSFNEFSMRYAKATDDFYVPEADDVRSQVGKPGAYSFEPVDTELAEQTRMEIQAVYETAFATYQRLVELGVARELARAVMPVGAYTEFFWTVNARALMNFVSLRAAETAQREIRRYAEACESLFSERMPVTHAAFVAAGRVAP